MITTSIEPVGEEEQIVRGSNMKILQSILALVLSLGVTTSGFAGEFSFRCTIQYEYHSKPDGQLEKIDKSSYKGLVFEIERRTGRIEGASLHLEPSNVKVVDSGEAGSFKMFHYNNNKIAENLVIKTWQKVKGKMPFIFIDYLENIVTGTCD
jgi:hypothetical protein